jgi:hypothetical protein
MRPQPAESAAVYLRRALAEPPSPEANAGLFLELGLAEFSAGWLGWDRHLEGAVKEAGDDATRIGAALVFASALGFHQRLAEAAEVCDGVATDVETRDPEGQFGIGVHGRRVRDERRRYRPVDGRSSRGSGRAR